MVISFEEFQKNALEFEKVLKEKCGKTIPINSNIEEIMLGILKLYSSFIDKVKLDNKIDYRSDWRKVVGLSDLINKILRIKDHPEFEKLYPHISLLLGDTKIVQNIFSPVSDGDSNKLFELLVASSLLPIGEHIELDDPIKSSDGKNPDVLIDIDNVCWGFACKVLHSSNPKSYIDNLSKGIEQIQNSRATKGCVILNFKNTVDHDAMWPISYDQNQEVIYGTYKNYLLPTDILLNSFYNTFEEISKLGIDKDYFPSLFEGKKALPISLNYLITVVGTKYLNQEIITTIKFIEPITFINVQKSDLLVIDKLNKSLQDYY